MFKLNLFVILVDCLIHTLCIAIELVCLFYSFDSYNDTERSNNTNDIIRVTPGTGPYHVEMNLTEYK